MQRILLPLLVAILAAMTVALAAAPLAAPSAPESAGAQKGARIGFRVHIYSKRTGEPYAGISVVVRTTGFGGRRVATLRTRADGRSPYLYRRGIYVVEVVDGLEGVSARTCISLRGLSTCRFAM